jgi:hypothetical protein
MTGRLDGLPGHVQILLWTHNDLPARQADLNTGMYRTVLRRGVTRWLTPEPSRLDIGLTVIDRSWGRMAGE